MNLRTFVSLVVRSLAVELLWRWSGSVEVGGIVGGQNTVPHEFPHMGLLGRIYETDRVEWVCGVSLITSRYALSTAYHISWGHKLYKIRFGEHDLNVDDGDHEDVDIARIILYPEYNRSRIYHNIALVELFQEIQFNRFVKPACLWPQDTIPQNLLVATGWGQLGHYEDRATVLQKVQIPIVSNDVCNSILYHDRRMSEGILASEMCAGDLARGGRDTCKGDSGGPLQLSLSGRNNCTHAIVGLTSFGGICGSAKTPSVYVRVSYYIPWIESMIGKQSERPLINKKRKQLVTRRLS